MRVQCTKCGAVGNVKSADPAKRFKCPKCGGAMQAVKETAAVQKPSRPTSAPGRKVTATVRRSKSIAARRRKSKSPSVLAIVLAGLVAAAVGAGGYYLYRSRTQPGPGARALALLPASTLAGMSVENVDRLETELARFSGCNPYKLKGAVGGYRKRAESWVATGLGVPYDQASRLVRSVGAAGVGIVPMKDGPPAVVVLLVLNHGGVVDELVADALKPAESISGNIIYIGRRFFLARLENTVALCSRREPLRSMIRSSVGGGGNSLGRDPLFTDARAAYSRKGRAWFYVSGAALKSPEHLGELTGPMSAAASLAPGMKYVAGFLKLDDPRVLARAYAELPDEHGEYDDVRLEPRELTTAEFMPADAQIATMLSLGAPERTYERVVTALNPKFKEEFGLDLRSMIEHFETGGEEKLDIASEVVPILRGEVGFFLSAGKMPSGAVILPVVEQKKALEVVRRLVKKVCGTEPKPTTQGGLEVWQAGSMPPVAYTFIDGALVVSTGRPGLSAVADARTSKKTLANDPGFKKPTAGLPTESTLLFVVRERAAGSEQESGASRASAAVSLSMERSGVSIFVSIPNAARALVAGAAGPLMFPAPEAETSEASSPGDAGL